MKNPDRSIYLIISEISLVAAIWLSSTGNRLYIQSGLLPLFAIIFIFPGTLAVFLSFTKWFRTAVTYLVLVSVVFSALGFWAFAFAADFTILPLYMIPILTSLYYVARTDKPWISRTIIFISSFLALALLSTLLRVSSSNAPFPFTVISINNDELPQGIPLLFQNALVVITRGYVLTVSVQFLFIVLLAASLLSENFILIYRNLNHYLGGVKSSITGTLIFVLGCQCETIIYAIPVFSAVLVSLILIPLTAAGIFLLVLSNIFLRGLQLRRGNRMQDIADSFYSSRTALFTGVIMLALILVSTLGAAMSWELDIFYFYGLNFLVFGTTYVLVSGLFVTGKHEEDNLLPASTAILLSMAVMVAWLIPYPESLAYNSNVVFGLMELSSFAGGTLLAVGNGKMSKVHRNVVLEMVSMMFTLAGVFILYYTDIFQNSLWSGFQVSGQLLFSVLLIFLSLPFLWFFNYVSIERKCNLDAAAG